MYFTKIISRSFIIVEGYEDEALSWGFNFFFIAVFQNIAQYLIYVGKSEISCYFLMGKAIITLRICDAPLIMYYKRNFNSDVPYLNFTKGSEEFPF